MPVLSFSDAGWDRDVGQCPLPVLVQFWAEWCRLCSNMVPSLEEVASAYDGRLRTGRLDIEENRDVRSRYSVRAVPTTILLSHGKEAFRRVGLVERQALLDLVASALAPGPSR